MVEGTDADSDGSAKINKHLFKTCMPSTILGSVVLIWSDAQSGLYINHILLSRPDEPADRRAERIYIDAAENSCPEIDSLCSGIESYLSGRKVCFPLDLLNLESCTPFQRAVLQTQHRVPYGCVSTYGTIAAAIGKPGAARAVGNALASNPFPVVIPCHRTVQSDGSIGGFQGNPGEGSGIKKTLLYIEGVKFKKDGNIDIKTDLWKNINDSQKIE